MRKRGLSVGTKSDDTSGHTYIDALGGQPVGGAAAELVDDLFRRVRPRKPVRVGRVSESRDSAELLASFQELVERLKFQGRSFRAMRPSANRRQYSGQVREASRNWRMGKYGV